MTPFCQKVYNLLKTVPRGHVTTYGALANALGSRSARAIGGALRRNPLAPEVPCHRVIAADGTPGGFKGRTSQAAVAEKIKLLAGEGVHFRNGRLVNRQLLYHPAPDQRHEH